MDKVVIENKPKIKKSWIINYIIIFLVIVFIVLFMGRRTFFSDYETGPTLTSEQKSAIDSTKSEPVVNSFITSVPDYDVTARQVDPKEYVENPVMYEGVDKTAMVVEYSKDGQGLLCVVDQGETKRCFNHINVGN